MTMTNVQQLGLVLRRARTLGAMGLRELAREASISATYLSKVENGQIAASERVLRLYADKFRVDFDELNRLAGRLSSDLQDHLVQTPEAIKRLRHQVKGKPDDRG